MLDTVVRKVRLDETLTIRLTKDEKEAIWRLRQEGETSGDFTREAIIREIERREEAKPKPRQKKNR